MELSVAYLRFFRYSPRFVLLLTITMNQSQLSVIHGNEVSPTVEDLWNLIFQCGEIVIKHSRDFGFEGMHKPQPNIHHLVLYVGLLEGAIDALTEDGDASFEEVRLLLNTKRRLATMKVAGKALKQGNRGDFEAAMKDLQNQAPF